MNCGLCGKPVYTGQPICVGCMKSRNRMGKRKQLRFDREYLTQQKETEIDESERVEESADEVWVE